MNTNFILCGGGLKKEIGLNNNIYSVISKYYSQSEGNITMVYHGMYEDQWTELFNTDKREFESKGIPNQRLVLGAKDDNDLKYQIADSGGLFIRGGSEIKLLNLFRNLIQDPTVLYNKTIFGASAGCNIFSKYAYSNDLQKVYDGLGVINHKTICHFNPEKGNQIIELSQYGESLPLLILPENKFSIIKL